MKVEDLGRHGFWRMANGVEVEIANMSHSHRRNAAAMIERFIQSTVPQCVDMDAFDGDDKVTNPLGLFALQPFQDKMAELLDGLQS